MCGMLGRGTEWGQAGNGRLGACGAPGEGGIARWISVGADAVVTLQRDDEMRGNIAEQCREGGIEWIHLPIEGRLSLLEPSEQDLVSICKIPLIAELLSHGRSVVVHCAAGMHRTGFVCYLSLRLCGLTPSESLTKLQEMRPVTYDQVVSTTRKHSRAIHELAEDWLQRPELHQRNSSEGEGERDEQHRL
jgi:protein-tyrosine phosphatase